MKGVSSFGSQQTIVVNSFGSQRMIVANSFGFLNQCNLLHNHRILEEVRLNWIWCITVSSPTFLWTKTLKKKGQKIFGPMAVVATARI